ncbi:hypothetical protein B0T26DRAFT_223841 [Lasiosphaeria miniovina]|uniref:Peroxin 11C n=1 Tax=Lasiosphaeria miniovina TaxID=1954250 RepID=A0AA40AV05_9PEZI|nr:uncharacterized protein B0T26DRAFT_223841 [Lasiosphaeria miniovina]KAK0722530.1 hypothetical protein B0T26DRAFT_223841 [Lasiosphaeria miniovina]
MADAAAVTDAVVVEAEATPITADLPSGEPIVASALEPSTSRPLTPRGPGGAKRSIPLRALLALAGAPGSVDTFLTRLNKCLATPAGIDTVMLFLGYASHLSASALRGFASRAAGPADTKVVHAAATAAAANALVLAARLKALSALLSEARTILRLWALLPLYFWARGLGARLLSSSSDTEKNQKTIAGTAPEEEEKQSAIATTVEVVRLALCIALQALENGAYLSSKGVLGWSPAQQGKAYKWSARFWAAYVGIELGRLAAEVAGPDPEDARAWRNKVVRNLAWAPLTLHWSTDGGLVSEPVVGVLATIPGVIQIRDLWAGTA